MLLTRITRLALFVLTPGAVVALSKLHATANAYDYSQSSRLAWSLSYATVLAVAAYAVGLPDAVTPRRAILSSVAAVGLGAGAVSLLQLIVGDALLPRFVVFGAAAVLVPAFTALAAVSSRSHTRAERRARVLFVGPDEDAENLRCDIALAPERRAIVAGHLRVPEGDALEPDLLRRTASEVAATVVVLSRHAQQDERLVHQAAALHESGVRVRTLSLFYEQWLGKLPVSELERVSLLFDISELHRVEYLRVKRLLDVALALAGMVALAAVVPFVVAGNILANQGPILYRQLRVGKGGVAFSILKFRTMTPQHGHLPNEWTAEDDPRITPFGRVLRKSHIDELPQMINILRGDLSVVGPRPEQPTYVDELVTKLPFYALRHLVRPGLTGWAQVKYGYAGTESDALEKLQYDFYYLRHQSLRFDLRIIGRTLRSVVGRRGR
jgi:lipopolysaccharide/colanic/teichoic acid biosynthesis glycosyltransferase